MQKSHNGMTPAKFQVRRCFRARNPSSAAAYHRPRARQV